MNLINYNGHLVPAAEGVITGGNRSFRYGDGIFETMRVVKGRIVLARYHWERLFRSMGLMEITIPVHFTAVFLEQEVLRTCRENHLQEVRVRLAVFRSGADDDAPGFLIECSPLEAGGYRYPDKGLMVDICPGIEKGRDKLAALKSANYLPYIIAAHHARQQGLDECLVLNAAGNICDGTISNIFWVKQGLCFTPPITEGGIAGVMRAYLVKVAPVQEALLTPEALATADEVFLTNAIRGIRWVEQFRTQRYTHQLSMAWFLQFLQQLPE